jgi:hypothetical protein
VSQDPVSDIRMATRRLKEVLSELVDEGVHEAAMAAVLLNLAGAILRVHFKDDELRRVCEQAVNAMVAQDGETKWKLQ